jgi:hypothetical protein
LLAVHTLIADEKLSCDPVMVIALPDCVCSASRADGFPQLTFFWFWTPERQVMIVSQSAFAVAL